MVLVWKHMPETGAVDELFDEFEEDTPEEVIALDERETSGDAPAAGAFEDFATVPERTQPGDDPETTAPDVDVDRLFGE